MKHTCDVNNYVFTACDSKRTHFTFAIVEFIFNIYTAMCVVLLKFEWFYTDVSLHNMHVFTLMWGTVCTDVRVFILTYV